ncbi:hypothetical protein B0H16DRAFT_313544 [Mycena metata]|uniref:SWIM-type domain-containing protein n=1 Tax=Mycena metata TaxID=1033252 RepID=A0AAD7JQ76_9AGAR|nr:hypothetical protein B0H16DRAFT_313544 [Mycena metata]
MAADALAEIDGYKPKVLLADGEDCEAKSKSGGMTYKIKRTQDHYFCHCPAWRNQKGVPVNARTCTHLGDTLGYGYELARLKLKTGKANGSSKSRKRDDSDDDEGDEEDEEEDEDEDELPKKKAPKPTSRGRGKRQADSDEEDDDEDEDEDERPKKKARKPASKAKGKKKADSEEDDSDSDAPPKRKASKSAPKGKGKRKADSEDEDDSDAPPKKKARKPASKAKGKKKVDSDEDDDQDSDESPKKKRKPASKAKGRKKVDSDDEADDSDEPPKKKAKKAVSTPKRKKKADSEEEEDSDEPPKKKARKPASKPKSKKKADSEDEDDEDAESDDDEVPSKGKGKKKVDSDEEDGDEDDDEDEKPTKQSKSTSTTGDDLAEIDGHKPKVLLDDGEDREVKSLTSSSTYKIKRTWDHYYCQCPAWRNQGGVPVNARTCKHLRDLLGEKYEAARLKWKNPGGAPLKPVSKKGKPKSKSNRAKGDDDEDDDDDDGGGKQVPAMLLANKWDIDTGPDPTGWWISEKLDGVRTFYDGKGMVSRLGNPFTPPKWFLDKLPKDCTLDGELFGGRGNFQDTVSIVKTMNSPHWKGITFQIFDVPSENTDFEDRVAFLKKLFGPGGKYECPEVVLVEHEKAKSRKHVLEKLKEIEELGGEGLMLRKAGSKYEGRRSSTLLKIKTFYDAEAEVTGYTDGKGKHAGITGALKCKMQSGKTFNVGTGLSDKLRRNPPKIGAIIVYRFQELTRDGVPRFPSYIGESADKTKAKDAKLPAHRKTGVNKDE